MKLKHGESPAIHSSTTTPVAATLRARETPSLPCRAAACPSSCSRMAARRLSSDIRFNVPVFTRIVPSGRHKGRSPFFFEVNGNRQDHTGFAKPLRCLVETFPQEFGGKACVADTPGFDGMDKDCVGRCPFGDFLGVGPHAKDAPCRQRDGHNGGFVQHESSPLGPNAHVLRSKIDADVVFKQVLKQFHGVALRGEESSDGASLHGAERGGRKDRRQRTQDNGKAAILAAARCDFSSSRLLVVPSSFSSASHCSAGVRKSSLRSAGIW